MSCNKSGSRRVPIQHYLMKKIGIERKINEYLLFDQQNVLQQIWQPESTNTALFDEKHLNPKKNQWISSIWSAKCPATNLAAGEYQYSTIWWKKIGIERKINAYRFFDQQNVLQQIWQPESTNTALFDEKHWNRKKNQWISSIWSAKCPATNLAAREYQYSTIWWKNWDRKKNQWISSVWSAQCPATNLAAGEYQYSNILEIFGIERKINEYLLFDQKNVLQQIWQPESTNTAIFWKLLESKEKSMNIFYLISKMSCNKSGSRRVPIQQYLMKKNWNRKKNQRISFFDQQNVLQQIWQPESTNTAIFWKLLESKEKSMNIFYLISKMSCNKSGSRRVPIQQYFGNFWNRKKNQWISSIWSAKCPATNLAAGECQYSTIWWKTLESKEKSMNIFYLISKMSCNKSGSRRVPIQHYLMKKNWNRKKNQRISFIWSAKCPVTNLAAGEYQYSTIWWKTLEPTKNSMNIFYLISKMSCNKSGSQRLPIQHYLMKKLESKEKSMNIFCLISKMSCNKSGSRSVPIQQYFGNFWNRKKNQRISCIWCWQPEGVPIQQYFGNCWNRKKNQWISSVWSAQCPATNLAAGEYQYSNILEIFGIERKINEYLLFDQKNVLQQIWQPESTNTAIFWKLLESKEKSMNIFYLISKMSCNKSGSRRVPIQDYLMKKNWNRKKNQWISSIWSAKCPATNLAAGEYQYSNILEIVGIERKINEYLLFDQQNVLQRIWQPESTNTAIFWKFLESKEKSMNIFYLISKMSCNKSGSRRVPIQQDFWKFLEWKEKSTNIFYLIRKTPKVFPKYLLY